MLVLCVIGGCNWAPGVVEASGPDPILWRRFAGTGAEQCPMRSVLSAWTAISVVYLLLRRSRGSFL